uniref:B-cell receptor CD22 first Ig-like domain-containing protein n=1 Tax=Anabas testudineus TaxID=64144 RepID=A0A3Q1J5L5_ANATE
GLCVVLPCSFTNDAAHDVTGLIWYKCNSAIKERCDISETGKLIFNSSSNENNEPEFRGRVSLLEPDVTEKNCSIFINDLRKSDSGSYQLRLVALAVIVLSLSTVVVKIKHCQTGSYCITLPEGEITAEAGLCVVLPCSFTNDAVFNVTGFIWHKCHSATNKRCDISGTGRLIFNSSSNENVEPEFRGRVSLLEPDVTKKNCSIIINDLRKSDSGSYELRLVRNRNGKTDGATFPSKAIITVTGTTTKTNCICRVCDISGTGRLIFNSSSNENVEPEFRGRVSLLEPDVTKKNCSIIINDLRKSDSGSYDGDSSTDRGTARHTHLHCSWSLLWICS